MKKINLKRGFTLIELLVVVAIIGILASVVLASLNTARSKGADAAIKADLANMRVQLALDYDTNQNYGAAVAGVGAACTGGLFSSDLTLKSAVAQVTAQAGAAEPSCYVNTSGSAFAIAAMLKTAGAGSYCVDSTGAGKVLATATASTAVAGVDVTKAVMGTAATTYVCQ